MDIRLYPAKLRGAVAAPPSKSHGHRLLVAAAVADGPTLLRLGPLADDLQATIGALRRLGMRFSSRGDGKYVVSPLAAAKPGGTLFCGDSGATLRFLLPLAAALGVDGYSFSGSRRLGQRPLLPLLEEMRRHGAVLSSDTLPIRLSGQLRGGEYRLDGGISSQFVTGLLLALPLLADDSRLTLTSPLTSAPYVDMTLAVSSLFGVEIGRDGDDFIIPGGQRYRSPGDVAVEGDWSAAAFWLVANALGAEIDVTGVSHSSCQGDKAIVAMVRAMTAGAATLRSIDIDAGDIPDLVPILAVAACAAGGTTRIYNAAKLRTKESDRLAAMVTNLTTLGATVEETDDGLVLRGGTPLRGGTVRSFNDHRIAMAMAVASLLCEEAVRIVAAEAVTKSYPAFFEDWQALGGRYDVL